MNLDDCSFAVTGKFLSRFCLLHLSYQRFVVGLKLMGADCVNGNELKLSDEIWTEISVAALRWMHRPGVYLPPAGTVSLPVYLLPARQNLLFTLDFQSKSNPASVFYERGIALILTTQLG